MKCCFGWDLPFRGDLHNLDPLALVIICSKFEDTALFELILVVVHGGGCELWWKAFKVEISQIQILGVLGITLSGVEIE